MVFMLAMIADTIVTSRRMRLRDLPDAVNEISSIVLSAAIEVHRALGPGLMESAYRDCLAHELRLRDRGVEVEREIPLIYKDLLVPKAFRADLVVDNAVILELKAVPAILPEHEAQLLTYLRASRASLGMILNFHAPRLVDGFRRIAMAH